MVLAFSIQSCSGDAAPKQHKEKIVNTDISRASKSEEGINGVGGQEEMKVEPREEAQDHSTSDKNLYDVTVGSYVDYVVEIRASSAEEAERIGSFLEIPTDGALVRNVCWPDDLPDEGCSFRWDHLEATNMRPEAKLISQEEQLRRTRESQLMAFLINGAENGRDV